MLENTTFWISIGTPSLVRFTWAYFACLLATWASSRDFDELEGTSTGIGKERLESYSVEIEKLKIGKLLIKNKLIVLLNLDHINAFYQAIGHPHIDGIIGCDLLVKYKSVIDISRKKLFVKSKE